MLLRALAGLVVGLLSFTNGIIVFAQQPQVAVIIRFTAPPTQAQAELVSNSGGSVTRQFRIVPAFAAQLPANAIEAMRKKPGVAAVELDIEIQAHSYANVWGVNRVKAPAVHSGQWVGSEKTPFPILGTGIRVAVVDTGIDYTHPDLLLNYQGGYDFVNNDSDPMDDHWHGTHVAGTIAALRNGTGVVGVAPEVNLYGLKVLNSQGSGSFSSIIAALDWAVSNGIQVVNLSLGSSSDPGTTVRQAFTNAYSKGLVIVASAGNAGSGTDTVGFPAKYDSVIAVASTTSSDARSSFSSTGPAVEIAAPGSSIYSTDLGGGYYTASGTSMAAPHVAGVAALILGAGITDLNGNTLVNDEVRWVLQATANDLGTDGRDEWFGFGLADAEAASWLAANPNSDNPPPVPAVFDPPSNLTGTAVASVATLTWQDNSNVEDGFELQFGVVNKNRTSWQTPIKLDADTTTHQLTLSDGSYRVRVRAFLSDQSTAWSNEISLSISTSSGNTKGGGKK